MSWHRSYYFFFYFGDKDNHTIFFICVQSGLSAGNWSSLRKLYGRNHQLVTKMEYLCHKWPRTCSTCRKHFHVLSLSMTYLNILIKKFAWKSMLKWKNKYRGSRIYSRGFIVHIYYGFVFLTNMKYQTVITVLWRVWEYNCVKKCQVILNSDITFLSFLSNVYHNYYQCIPKKVDVEISKRRCTLGSYKWEVTRWSQFVLSENSNYLLWKHYKPLPTHLSISTLGYIVISCQHILLSNMLILCFLC